MAPYDANMTAATENIKSVCKGGGVVIAVVVVGLVLAGATLGIVMGGLFNGGRNHIGVVIILASLSVVLIALGVFLQALANGTRSSLMLTALQNQREVLLAAHVDNARLSSFLIDPPAVTLTVGTPSKSLTATPRDQDGNPFPDTANLLKPKWESSNPAIATVDQSGLVQRVLNGATTVTASFGMIRSNSCTITCTD